MPYSCDGAVTVRGSMHRNLFSYIWRYSRPEQLIILGLVLLAQGFYFLSLSVPKSIVNNGISGNAFKDAATIRLFAIDIPVPTFLGGHHQHLFNGFLVNQLQYLVIMSFVFLAAVIVNNQFRKSINTQKGRMASACCAACATSSTTASCAFLPRTSARSSRPSSPP